MSLSIYSKHLQTLGISIPHEAKDVAYERYCGDSSVPGHGEILIWKGRAS